MRTGIGYDIHPLVEGRKLILGGVEIGFPKGLAGHSDADVLSHAIGDALLGAAGAGDIGRHFPDSDESYRGISSLELLRKIQGMIAEKKLAIENIDATVVAETPRLASFISEMIRKLAEALRIEDERVNIKATTSEGFGAIGRGEAIAALAVTSLRIID